MGSSDAGSVETPHLRVDMDKLLANILAMQAMVSSAGAALRPHFKTHKSVSIARMQLDHGAIGMTCATLREAEVLVGAGFRNIFLAYPLVISRATTSRIRRLHVSREVSFAVSCLEAGNALVNAIVESGGGPRIMIEVECGCRRTGMQPEDVGSAARLLARRGAVIEGIFAYPGHAYEPGRQRSARLDQLRALESAAVELSRAGFQDFVISAGSTPTMQHEQRSIVTEFRPGTYIFGDRRQSRLAHSLMPQMALMVAATVVQSGAQRTVVDAGAKCLGQDRPSWLDGFGEYVADPNATIGRLYDHHGVFDVPLPKDVGESLLIYPNNANTVVNLQKVMLLYSPTTEVSRLILIDARIG